MTSPTAVKDSQRFAEMERLMSDYFVCHLAPVMRNVQRDLSQKQAEEMRDYTNSTAGILSFMAAANMPGQDPYSILKVTGEWNSKITEDYLAMCKEAILGNEALQSDLLVMAEEWRNAVVAEVGRERYDALSEQLGCDLALAYVDHRMEQLMIDKLVKDHMPRSSADYIIRKAAQTSLFGLAHELGKSPLAAEIDARGEAAYKPSRMEKAAGWAVGTATDAVATGGIGSWAAFARFVGIDVAFNVGMNHLGKKESKGKTGVEDCISKGVFGSDTNLFVSFRTQAKHIKNHENSHIKAVNNQFKNKIPTQDYTFMDWTKQSALPTFPLFNGLSLAQEPSEAAQRKGKYKDVPLIVAPGHEDAYLEGMARQNIEPKKEEKEAPQEAAQTTQEQETVPPPQQEGTALQRDGSGWDGLLQSFGLDGFSDIGKNLGYVLAMLPDVVVGLFTGKTKSLDMKGSLPALATIVGGMFVRNPILKMLLISMGGANLLNKAGHEVLYRKQQEGSEPLETRHVNSQARYRQYPDEPLDPRISNPTLRGRCLVAHIDNVPCTIQLPEAVIGAYRSGALPLNTLANAILAKNDQMRQIASAQYEENARETMVRPRGIQ